MDIKDCPKKIKHDYNVLLNALKDYRKENNLPFTDKFLEKFVWFETKMCRECVSLAICDPYCHCKECERYMRGCENRLNDIYKRTISKVAMEELI